MTNAANITTDSDYGTLHDYQTGEAIRPATADELVQSLAAGESGAFDLDGRSVYVGRDQDPALVADAKRIADLVSTDTVHDAPHWSEAGYDSAWEAARALVGDDGNEAREALAAAMLIEWEVVR